MVLLKLGVKWDAGKVERQVGRLFWASSGTLV